ncbi:MAG TPA: transcription antitermination factor NusB [Thermoanaerobaculia bacterium]|nr:transcription antitermination factor NusB [Thermoanaerobaculia bacterium]
MAGKRHTAREMAVQMLYQRDMGGAELPQVFKSFDLGDYVTRERDSDGKRAKGKAADEVEKVRQRVQDAFDHARSLVQGTDRHREQIDELIRSQADNWRLERMPVVDRNILRLAVYEMLHQPEVPKLVVVDEAIELAKKYGSDQSGRFVNGLLDGLLKQRAFPGSPS